MSGICIADTRKFEAQVLPKLPTGSMNIWQKISQGKLEYRELAQIVETDPILAGEVIKITNSSFYGLQGKVGNVLRAIILLGNQTIRSLVRGLILRKARFESSHLTPDQLKQIWSHNLVTAILARSIAVQSNLCDPEEAFLTGLLHDLGKLISPGNQHTQDHSQGMVILEELHVEFATLLCTHWNMPEKISQTILWHHQSLTPVDEEIAGLHTVLRVANTLAKVAGYASDDQCLVEIGSIDPYFRKMGKMEYLRQALVQLPDAYKAMATPFGLPVNENFRHADRHSIYIGIDLQNQDFAYLFDLMIFNRGFTPAAYYGPRQDNLKISLLIHDGKTFENYSAKIPAEIPVLSLSDFQALGLNSLAAPASCQLQRMIELIEKTIMKAASHE